MGSLAADGSTFPQFHEMKLLSIELEDQELLCMAEVLIYDLAVAACHGYPHLLLICGALDHLLTQGGT